MTRFRRCTRDVAVGSFLLAVMFMMIGCSASGSGDGGAAPAAEPPTDDDIVRDDDASLIAREIEEADIVKLHDGYLYLANRYRGLRVIDARAIERPEMVGGADAPGRGVELYVRGDHVFLITSADVFYCAGTAVGFSEVGETGGFLDPGYQGSRVWVFDVNEPRNPQSVAVFDIDGYVTATRRVGDVLYVTGNELWPNEFPEDVNTNGEGMLDGSVDRELGGTFSGRVYVQSINIADPAEPQAVETEHVAGEALEIHVSTRAIYVAGLDPDMADTTRVTYVDISDPAGAIAMRDTFRVPGTLRNRFFMDEYQDYFRVVTQEQLAVEPGAFRDIVALYTYDIQDPDNVDRLSRLTIETDEDVWAVRFDGERGYVVTFRQIDPLFVLDLSDPAEPLIAGELEVPGFSTHLVPMGERLLAIGFDGQFSLRPAVSLYDVSIPALPRLLSRVWPGELNVYGITSEATFDEKALRVLAGEGLVLVPFSYMDHETLAWVDSVQLIDLLPNGLAERGKADHRGLVRRTSVLDDRLWMLSDESFGVFDIDDRDDPTAIAAIDLISEQALLDAGLVDCVDSARHRENPEVFIGRFEFVDFDFWPLPAPCGVMGTVSAGMLVSGLLGIRLMRGRRQ